MYNSLNMLLSCVRAVSYREMSDAFVILPALCHFCFRKSCTVFLLKTVLESKAWPKIRSKRCGVTYINARKKCSGTPFRLASFWETTFDTAFQRFPSRKYRCVREILIFIIEIINNLFLYLIYFKTNFGENWHFCFSLEKYIVGNWSIMNGHIHISFH
jgi:hypothetical protein